MSISSKLHGGTDMSENAFERDIVADMVQRGWIEGDPNHFDRGYVLDLMQLEAFLVATQPQVAAELELADPTSTIRAKFLARLQGQLTTHGVVHLLRSDLHHDTATGQYEITLFGGTPSPGNAKALALHNANRWSVTRQLRYSKDSAQLALDLAIFVNGLPLATFELKNNITKQTVDDAVAQYKNTRDHKELLFSPGRCLAHFALDDQSVRFCTKLDGKASWFLPFDKGWNDGTGNPPNPDGFKTAYLWQDILDPPSLTDIIEHYAFRLETKHPKTGRKKYDQIFPRYHQLDVVRKLLADAVDHGAGQRYLIQHSAGSGKSNSIAWLALQLIGLERDGVPAFDSVIVVTDRVNLDTQINRTIRQFTQVRSTVAHADRSGDLRKAIQGGTKIIISTVQKFPVILGDIGSAHRERRFAIVIDEAHSSQGGKTAHAMSKALSSVSSPAADESADDESTEDKINRIIDSQKMLDNASYYAFTATPKSRTLDLFGRPGEDGKPGPFHSYTMKQAIQERFILDVLQNYTSINSYYKLVKSVADDPEFDAKKAAKKLRSYVEGHPHAIQVKAEIMVDHFLDHVVRPRKIGGKARAMVVADGVDRALEYFHAIDRYLKRLGSPHRAIIAFSGEHEYAGVKVTEANLNGFPSKQIEETFSEEPYRFLVCADKFQTGYDEPLLHTMYVDKPLSSVRAVQTLSRLNRAHIDKHDVAVLDFFNKPDVIQKSFEEYYRTTFLSERADPNKLHDLKSALDRFGVYTDEHIEKFVTLYLAKASRARLDPILDICAATYRTELDEDDQVEFKGKAKAFTRTYDFLAGVLPYRNANWLKLSILLNHLVPKLPAPAEDDLSRGVLETVDVDSYRAEQERSLSIALNDADATIEPASLGDGSGRRSDPELRRISEIVGDFNRHFGNINWTDADQVLKVITEDLPAKVSADPGYQRAQLNNDEQNARIEHDKVLDRAMVDFIRTHTELYQFFTGNESFGRWLKETNFAATYKPDSEGDDAAGDTADDGTE